MPEKKFYYQSYPEYYAARALQSFYTTYKNREIAETMASLLDPTIVLDIGCNFNGIYKGESSLRYQLETRGFRYIGLDLSSKYFEPTSLDNKETYHNVNGVVGDATSLPFYNSCIEGITCADVLEHISNPQRALNEIRRVVRPGGFVIIVVPSMYKLDGIMLNDSYIPTRRYSTHCNKLPLSDWLELCSKAGLVYTDKSKPLGIASGLSYLMWLKEEFIPKKQDPYSAESYPRYAPIHAAIKDILTRTDPETDKYYQRHPKKQERLIELLLSGRIPDVFIHLYETVAQFINKKEQSFLNYGFERFREEFPKIPTQRIQELVIRIQHLTITFPNMEFIGNSALLVLKKQ